MNHSVEAVSGDQAYENGLTPPQTPAFSLSAITSISAKDTEQVRQHIAAAQPNNDTWLHSTITGELFAMAVLHRAEEGLSDEVATWPRFFVAVHRIQKGSPMWLRTAGILLFEHQSDGSFRLDVWLTKADRNHGIEQAAFLQSRSLIIATFPPTAHFRCVAFSAPWSFKAFSDAPELWCAMAPTQQQASGVTRWVCIHHDAPVKPVRQLPQVDCASDVPPDGGLPGWDVLETHDRRGC
jgi:hypothetical protein